MGGRALLRRVVQILETKKVESGCFLETVFFLYPKISQTKKTPAQQFSDVVTIVTTQHFFLGTILTLGLKLDPGIAPPSAFPQAERTLGVGPSYEHFGKKNQWLKRKTHPKKLT